LLLLSEVSLGLQLFLPRLELLHCGQACADIIFLSFPALDDVSGQPNELKMRLGGCKRGRKTEGGRSVTEKRESREVGGRWKE
jgi:hypothetical protein